MFFSEESLDLGKVAVQCVSLDCAGDFHNSVTRIFGKLEYFSNIQILKFFDT